jgi:hypothetical protein
MDELRVFVWTGKGVLPAYGTGLVAVIAASELDAWEKMKAEKFGVYCNLFHGGPSYFDEQCELTTWLEERDENEEDPIPPITPKSYDLLNCPVLSQRGTD